MNPTDAAKQLQYAVASQADDYQVKHWEATAYNDVFADVVERGELDDVMTVVETLGDEFTEESCPSVERARVVADDILTQNGRMMTDGGPDAEDD